VTLTSASRPAISTKPFLLFSRKFKATHISGFRVVCLALESSCHFLTVLPDRACLLFTACGYAQLSSLSGPKNSAFSETIQICSVGRSRAATIRSSRNDDKTHFIHGALLAWRRAWLVFTRSGGQQEKLQEKFEVTHTDEECANFSPPPNTRSCARTGPSAPIRVRSSRSIGRTFACAAATCLFTIPQPNSTADGLAELLEALEKAVVEETTIPTAWCNGRALRRCAATRHVSTTAGTDGVALLHERSRHDLQTAQA